MAVLIWEREIFPLSDSFKENDGNVEEVPGTVSKGCR